MNSIRTFVQSWIAHTHSILSIIYKQCLLCDLPFVSLQHMHEIRLLEIESEIENWSIPIWYYQINQIKMNWLPFIVYDSYSIWSNFHMTNGWTLYLNLHSPLLRLIQLNSFFCDYKFICKLMLFNCETVSSVSIRLQLSWQFCWFPVLVLSLDDSYPLKSIPIRY